MLCKCRHPPPPCMFSVVMIKILVIFFIFSLRFFSLTNPGGAVWGCVSIIILFLLFFSPFPFPLRSDPLRHPKNQIDAPKYAELRPARFPFFRLLWLSLGKRQIQVEGIWGGGVRSRRPPPPRRRRRPWSVVRCRASELIHHRF